MLFLLFLLHRKKTKFRQKCLDFIRKVENPWEVGRTYQKNIEIIRKNKQFIKICGNE